MNSLKFIASDIEHIKESLETTDELHQTVCVLKDTIVHLVRQNNWLCESMKAMKKDLRTLREDKSSSHSIGKQKIRKVSKSGEASRFQINS